MGNCIVMEKKVIKIMRNDGKVIEYKGEEEGKPIKVHQILTKFSAHFSLFDSLSNNTHLHPQSNLLSGRLYYLIPKQNKTKKKVTFADSQDRFINCGDNNNTKEEEKSVVRVKMVITKQELQKLLQGSSVHDLVFQNLAKIHDHDNDGECHRSWKPLLDSIPESD